jgi:hypothetical protein
MPAFGGIKSPHLLQVMESRTYLIVGNGTSDIGLSLDWNEDADVAEVPDPIFLDLLMMFRC